VKTATARASDTQWLDEPQQRAWRAFLGGQTVLFHQLDRDLRTRHDLSMPEYEIFVRLSEAPDRRLRMAELADAVAHSRSRVTHTISRLESAGLVERVACPEDGRGVVAGLTAKGFRALEQAAGTHVDGVRDYLIDNASPEELAALERVFERVRARLGGSRF
jgi:DNA-binding MarR family transcriptional regulator